MPNDASGSEIESLLIVGAGWSGRQIAAQSAAHGIATFLMDAHPQIADEAKIWIRGHIQERVEEGTWKTVDPVAAASLVTICTPADCFSRRYDFILESVTEQISVKRRVLREISSQSNPQTIIGSNSSYFVPSILSKYVEHPERFVHFHFHLPVWIATVVDIVPGPAATEDVLERLVRFAKRIGQTPILERKENPGYLFNWMLQAWLQSALQLAKNEIASPREIDEVWTKVSGMRIGPFATMDLIGIDVIHQVLSNGRWVDKADDVQGLIDWIRPLVENQQLGIKTKKGFFDYGERGDFSLGETSTPST